MPYACAVLSLDTVLKESEKMVSNFVFLAEEKQKADLNRWAVLRNHVLCEK